MNSSAYLVFCIDARSGVPLVIGAGIFTESASSLTLRHRKGIGYCDAFQVSYGNHPGPKDFDEAQELLRLMAEDHGLDWCLRMLDDERFDEF